MEIGKQLGEYIIEAEIGGGGMAKVYRARHAVLESLHALKVLDDKYRANPEARRRFLDEAKIQAKHLQHPGIVKVTNIVSTADAAALVMDLVDGGSLEGYLAEKKRPLTGDELLAFAVPILDAIAAAHDAGIIHRDLKPANVLLKRQGDRLVPMITDFGIAKVTDSTATAKKKSTHADARMGTLGYMSPEQIRKAKEVTQRSDIFSLGAMFYEMATGRVPFEGDSDFDVMEAIVHGKFEPPEKLADPKVPPNIINSIKRAMDSDPAKRFADCREFSAAITGGKPVGYVPAKRTASAISHYSSGSGAPRWKLFGAITVAAVAAGGVAVYFAMKKDPQTQTTEAVVPKDAAESAVAKVDPGSGSEHTTTPPAPPPVDASVAPLQPEVVTPADPNAAPPDVKSPPYDAAKTTRGVSYKYISAGTGKMPGQWDKVAIKYKAWTASDGRLIDNTDDATKEVSIPNPPMAGLADLLTSIQVGSKVRAWIPANLAYKNVRGKPKGMIVYELEVVSHTEVPPPSCKGKWSGGDASLTITEGSSCGRASIAGCTGSLHSCKDGPTFTGTFGCNMSGTAYTMTVSMNCMGSSSPLTARLTAAGQHSTLNFSVRR